MMEAVYADESRNLPISSTTGRSAAHVTSHNPTFSPTLRDHLERARGTWERAQEGYDLVDFNYGGFGKAAVKQFGMSPGKLI